MSQYTDEMAEQKAKSITKIDDAIRLYATIISEDKHDFRIEIHERLCELLGVSKEEFAPFEGMCVNLGSHWTPEMCEYLIRQEIKRLKVTASI